MLQDSFQIFKKTESAMSRLIRHIFNNPAPAVMIMILLHDMIGIFHKLSRQRCQPKQRDWMSFIPSEEWELHGDDVVHIGHKNSMPGKTRSIHRSEERRVGKECRSRWSTYH